MIRAHRRKLPTINQLQLTLAIVLFGCAQLAFAQQLPAYGQFLSDSANSPMPPAAAAPQSVPAAQYSAGQSLSPLPPLINQYPESPVAQLAALQANPIATNPPDTLAADPSRLPARLASYPRDVTEPLLDQPDNFVLLPEASQTKGPPQRD